ncbi:hypothetical protein TCAL_01183 [Tigriopus californicus]|uniref:Uncharacterized protein n=1 Tax=Tigriopus californicus TaxID=6832 RepID=A0A553NZT1_TIGCA|nr:hypothetical protein TCAL_01183 [Tigriopus californicus]|eukprot:TCALIF_01183-PA protein Name:"Protein of unknown function" AED:0.24 eAED:0.38 QI:0/0/0.5/1/0/0.5/2/207/491
MNEGDLNVVLAQLEGNLSLLAKHFNLSIFIQDLARPSIHVEKHSTRNSFASMLNFVPRMDFEYEPVELVILMAFFEPLQSLNISNLQFNLRLLLHSLPFGSFFKIVTPIDQGESVPIGTEAITSASSTLDNLEWNTYDVRGGEQFSQVLVQEVESPVGAGLPIRRKNIHVLTNNDPNLKDETLDVVRKSSELLSIFVLSVESRSDDCSLETLASLGRGFCETLSDNGLTSNGRKVIGILKCILQPVYRAKVCWHKRYMKLILSIGQDVHVHLTCERPKADFKMEFMSTSSTNTKIHQVGAFCRIKELELEFTPNTRAELVKVSETFQVLSNATSFYWMSDNQEEHVSQVQQGAPVPTAVHESGRHLAPAYRKPYWEQINVLNTPFEEVNQLEGLDYLLNFQSNDGGFAPSDDLSTFLFGKAWELDQCRADHEEAKVWATALVVWVLRIRMDKLKELWCLVEDKALKWLQSNHANADDVLAKAQNTISISAK